MSLEALIRESGAYKMISEEIAKGRMAHAYLTVSEDTAAVDALHRLIAMRLYCGKAGCGVCPDCRKILRGEHEDIYTLAEKAQVSEMRDFIFDVGHVSFSDRVKIYRIPSAERLSENAQNRLLKTLEEPPRNVLFLIGVGNENSLLDTVRSRCRIVRIERFGYQKILSVLAEKAQDTARIEMAAVSGDGLVSRALALLEDEAFLERYDLVCRLLSDLSSSKDVPKWSATLPSDAEEMQNFLDIFEIVLGNLLRADAGAGGTSSRMQNLSKKYNARSLANFLDILYACKEQLRFNCSVQAVADRLLFGILEVSYQCRSL